MPCGFAAGIAGVLPKAGSYAAPSRRRSRTVASPISATIRPKMPDRLTAIPPLIVRTLAEARRAENEEVRACMPGSGRREPSRTFGVGLGALDRL